MPATLRGRLIAGLVTLLAIACATVGLVTYLAAQNALSDELLGDLVAALQAARDDDAVRCVVLTSTHDRVFSAGANLAGFAADAPLVIPALNRDGDCLSDLIMPMFGSIAAAESVLLSFDPFQGGDGALANIAIDRALNDDPGYSMALLLREALDSGAPPGLARLPMTPEEVAAAYDAADVASR